MLKINRFFFVVSLITANFLFSQSARSFDGPPNSIEDFVKIPTLVDPQISPDGIHMTVKFRNGDENMLGIMDVATNKIIKAFKVSGANRSVGDIYWINNERIIYGVKESRPWDKRLFDTGELFGVNIDGSKHKIIFGFNAGESQTESRIKKRESYYGNYVVIDILKGDDKDILLAYYPWKEVGAYWRVSDDVKPEILQLNTYTGMARKVGFLPLPLADGITDTDGKVRFSIGEDNSAKKRVYYRENSNDDWLEFAANGFKGNDVLPISFSADNQSVYVSANVDNGTRALYLLNLKTQTSQLIYHNPDADISMIIKNFNENKVVAVRTDLTVPEYHYVDIADSKASLHKALRGAFGGYDVFITSVTEKGDKIIVRTVSDFNPSSYYLFNTKTLEARFLMSAMSWIDFEKTASTKTLKIKMRDGTFIYGYLTRPFEKTENLPLVVLPHGGPHGMRDFWGFDWEAQLLASQGFAVLQVNYRGSSGYGKQFEEAGHGKWGTLMQDDLTDATLSLIADKTADPKRICIFGNSYGGYAALMGVAREPDLYRCAIGSMGVYDLPMMFTKGDVSERESGLAYLKDVLGENVEDQKNRSPVYNVEKIKAKLLLIHGKRDQRAPIEQAEALKDALKRVNKDYQWLELSNEGHGYNDEANRLEVYQKVVDFLQENIGSKVK